MVPSCVLAGRDAVDAGDVRRTTARPKPTGSSCAGTTAAGSARWPRARCTASSPTATAAGSTRRRCCSIRTRPRCSSRRRSIGGPRPSTATPNTGRGPLAVARPAEVAAAAAADIPRRSSCTRPTSRGMTRLAGGDDAGTYRGMIGQLDRLAALGVTVLELLPVHQNDPQEGSYWGYMPLAFGAVHRQYAAGADAAERARRAWSPPPTSGTSRCGSTSSSTTPPRSTPTGPTYHLRGLADGDYYRLDDRGRYIETTRMRQRHRHQLACGAGPDRVVARPARRPRRRRLPLRSGAGAQPAPAVRRPARRMGRPPWRPHDRRAVGCVGTHELGRAWPGARLDAVERPLPRGRPRRAPGRARTRPGAHPARAGEPRCASTRRCTP